MFGSCGDRSLVNEHHLLAPLGGYRYLIVEIPSNVHICKGHEAVNFDLKSQLCASRGKISRIFPE